MSLFYHFGKLLLLGTVIAHGALILTDSAYESKWKHDVKSAMSHAPVSHDIRSLVNQNAGYLLLGIAGFQCLSILNFLFRKAQCIAVINIIGLLVMCAVKANPFLASNPKEKNHAIQDALKYLALIGGLLWYCSSSLTHLHASKAKRKN
mmetsp:Transcript_14630/g.16814  ORF Transcript_14630/g.16814 Transcript_14630/m.16814 type:complete len:149 (-) Transcript_14630:173-619(-)